MSTTQSAGRLATLPDEQRLAAAVTALDRIHIVVRQATGF
jgi:hypothetical protein